MRILFVDRFFGGFDGPGTFLFDLMSDLGRRGHRVALAYGVEKGDFRAPVEAFHVPQLATSPFGSPAAADALEQILRAFRPDIVSAQTLDVYWFARQVRAHCPLVATLHTHAATCPNWSRWLERSDEICDRDFGAACAFHTVVDRCGFARPWALASNLVRTHRARVHLREVDAIQMLSPYMRATLERAGLPSERLFDLPARAPFFDEARRWAPPSAPRILYVGRLHPTKGVHLLVEACARLRSRFELVIVGTGPLEGRLRAQIDALGLTQRTRLIAGQTEPLSRAELSEMYRQSSVLVVPSIWGDPAPLVRLEAMAYGRPVVGFDSGGVASTIFDGVTGFVVPRLDVAQLAARIDEILSDAALAERLGRAALDRVHAEHHPDRIAARHESVYGRIIESRLQ